MSGSPTAAAEEAAGRLARVHLRTGLLRLARVELEELAGEGGLVADGVLDLAEARWRTGDLRGAAEAAGAWLDAGSGAAVVAAADRDEAGRRAHALAHALIADGLTVRGRHEDAAVHVAATLEALQAAPAEPARSEEAVLAAGAGGPTGSVIAALDSLFVGISPRAEAWPAFEPGDHGPGQAADVADGEPVTRVFTPSRDPSAPDPIAAADERLAAGDDATAAVLLVLALRAAPSRARDVLARADAALATRRGAPLLLARAEALRALGRHEAAGIAYADADAHARGGIPAPAAAATTDPDSHTPDPEGSPR